MSRHVSTLSLLMVFLLVAFFGLALAETADEAALRDAARDEKRDEVERLLDKGTSPNVPDHNGRTAVHHAAVRANAAILEALLEAGGDPDAQDAAGSTPLHLAADFPYVESDSQLSVRTLLSYGADPDLADREGRTPLHLVAEKHKQATSVRDLVSSGADVNATDRRGDTPLHYAIGRSSKFSPDVVGVLVIIGGADVNVRGGSGETPLQLFVRVGTNDGRVANIFVNAGADIDGKNPDGETPLQLFVRVGTNDGRVANIFVNAGADIDGKNPDGETPLHTAIRNGGSRENDYVVEALLEKGADPCIRDASGYIPYNTAHEGGWVHTMLANTGGSDSDCQGAEDPVADYVVDPADWRGETTARANIRSGPGTDHDVVSTLAGGTPVHVTGTVRNTDWLRADVAGETAFVHASLVEKIETAADMAAVEEDAAPEDASGVDATVASIDTEPKCRDWNDDMPVDTVCWWEFTQPSGCFFRGLAHQYTFHDDEVSYRRETTWSGACEAGVATGEGTFTHTIVENIYGHPEFQGPQVIELMSGHYVDGVKQGDWIDQHYPDDASAKIFEGPYVDGQRHGRWIEHSGVNNEYANNQCTSEGLMVQGKREGEWVKRCNNGHCDVGEYADGEQIDYWWC